MELSRSSCDIVQPQVRRTSCRRWCVRFVSFSGGQEVKEVNNLTSKLSMRIMDYNMPKLLEKAKGKEVLEAFLELPRALSDLEMPGKFNEIVMLGAVKGREALMKMLPAQLEDKMADEGLQASVAIDPPPPEEAPPVAVEPPRNTAIFRVKMKSREAVLRKVEGLTNLVVSSVPDRLFLKLLRRKLTGQLEETMREQVGEAVDLNIETLSDKDSHTDSFWLTMRILDMDMVSLLRKTKGDKFADGFAKLISIMHVFLANGIQSMVTEIPKVYAMANAKFLSGLEEIVPQKLAEVLGAQVWPVSPQNFRWLRNEQAKGRCCKGKIDQVYWVGSSVLYHGYFGHAPGFCPHVAPFSGCASSRSLQITQETSGTTFTDCFQLADANETALVGLSAIKVNKTCS
ncbi:unnamed protein product [Effrenium voratum]|nr:unnamed protein product [Effrenium voratum]